MKQLATLILLLLFCHSFAQKDAEKITVPKGIVYNYCDKSFVDKARELITADLKNADQYNLCDNVLIVGPVLWNRFRKISKLEKIEGGNTTFMVDKNKLTGKTTQQVEDTKKVWDELRKEINGKDFTIRKLNEKELQYYWAIISFDIDEPLLIVETKDHKYILNILKDKMKLMWLDEAPQ